jgi:hypothetical protein
MNIPFLRWILTQHCTDLGLLTRETCLDTVLLPFAMAAFSAGSASSTVQAMRGESINLATSNSHLSNSYSIILGQLTKAPVNRKGLSVLMGTLPVVELRGQEIQAGSMREILSGSKMAGQDYLIGLNRYAFHTSILKGKQFPGF